MKRCFLLLLIILPCLWYSCNKEKDPGSIHGIVSDKATGEPIQRAGVELVGKGVSCNTGSDGQFSFENLQPGDYSIHITRLGYSEVVRDIAVKSNDPARIDVQLEKLPPALRIVDGNGNDIECLDFGSITGDDSRLFNIFNDGNSSLDWQITVFSDWLSVNKDSGSLDAGSSVGVIAYIDRGNLLEGENQTSIHITSNNGSRQISAIAFTGEIYTSSVSEIIVNSAVFNAIIHRMENSYTERGFLYSATVQTPTLNTDDVQKTVIKGLELGKYSAKVSGLASGQTYYVRAYMKNDNKVTYGNVVSFTTAFPAEYVIIPLARVMVQSKNLGYTTHSTAETMCKNSTVGGFSDWRLPTVEECQIICNYKHLLDSISGRYWTADKATSSSGYYYTFGFATCSTDWDSGNSHDFYIRAVRSINQ